MSKAKKDDAVARMLDRVEGLLNKRPGTAQEAAQKWRRAESDDGGQESQAEKPVAGGPRGVRDLLRQPAASNADLLAGVREMIVGRERALLAAYGDPTKMETLSENLDAFVAEIVRKVSG